MLIMKENRLRAKYIASIISMLLAEYYQLGRKCGEWTFLKYMQRKRWQEDEEQNGCNGRRDKENKRNKQNEDYKRRAINI